MIFIYNFFLYLIGIIFFPLILVILLINKKWQIDVSERLGIIPKDIKESARNKKILWFHAASVGEVQALAPVVRELKKLSQEKEIIITTTSINGKNRIKKELGDIVFYTALLPLDFDFAVKRFINSFNIELFIIMETEIWPNLINYANKKNIPVTLINGRISDKTFKFYYMTRFFIAGILNKIFFVIVQNEKMKKRFIKMGVNEKKIMIIYNVKYSFELKVKEDYKMINKNRKLFIVAGSIREKEEDFVLNVLNILKKENIVFFIAPRHLERVGFIIKLLEKYKFSFQKYSLIKDFSDIIKYELILVDTMGDLMKLYSIGDIAIVGGGFEKLGGHNPLEPAFFALPVITGKFMYNFEDTTEKMIKQGGTFQVETTQNLYDILNKLIENENLRKEAGKKNKEIIEKMQGTAETTAVILNEILLEKSGSKNV